MPFGMKNAPAVFQREMQRVLKDRLYNGVMVFIDDILIYSKTAEEHAELCRVGAGTSTGGRLLCPSRQV